jgi:hypothetical protein
MRGVTNYLVIDFGGGPWPWKLAWVINFQNAGTPPLLGFVTAWYHNIGTAPAAGLCDAQKYFTQRLRRGLITCAMYHYIRHPNYLGELMLYGSFALMVWHWLPFVVLAWIWGGIFVVNMPLKETSTSRYPRWAAAPNPVGIRLSRPAISTRPDRIG